MCRGKGFYCESKIEGQECVGGKGIYGESKGGEFLLIFDVSIFQEKKFF